MSGDKYLVIKRSDLKAMHEHMSLSEGVIKDLEMFSIDAFVVPESEFFCAPGLLGYSSAVLICIETLESVGMLTKNMKDSALSSTDTAMGIADGFTLSSKRDKRK